MSDKSVEPEVQRRQLHEVLLGHLERARVPVWPGADSLTVADVLRTYLPAAAAGLVPGREQLLAEHPDLERVLAAFFTGTAGRRGGDLSG